MSDNKKYYYLKFKETYFDNDHIKVIEAMENGYIYSLIILKLYLKSLKWEGQLRINEAIPYMKDKIDLLAKIINHDPDHVSKAVTLGKDLGIITIISSGEIFMSDIQNFIGVSSSEAERKKNYRARIKTAESKYRIENGQTSDKRPPELELELDLELEKDLKKQKKHKKEKKEKELGVINEKLQDDVDDVYDIYPSKCVKSGASTGKLKKHKKKIEMMLKKMEKCDMINTINKYVREQTKAQRYIKNFQTFLNNFPEPASASYEYVETYEQKEKRLLAHFDKERAEGRL